MIKKNKLSNAVVAAIASLYGMSAVAQGDQALEEVFVEGIRGSLMQASERKQNASSIQDSIVAEDIGKFPDQNVAESLQRITGVSISRTNGEGSKITVRGFGPQFNVVRIDGRTLATTDGGREFDFQVLPSELISGADIIKSPTANLEAGSIGAYVNITTAKPLDNPGLHMSGSVDARYGELSDEIDPGFSGIISQSNAANTFGFLLGVAYKESNSRIDKYRTNRWHELYALPENLSGDITDVNGNVVDADGFVRPGRAVFEIQEETRERTGANAVFQWAPNDKSITTFDVLYTDLSWQVLSLGVQMPTQAAFYNSVVIDEDQTLVSAQITENNIDGLFRQVGQESNTLAFGLNSIYDTGNLTLEIDGAYSKAEADPRRNEFVPHFTLDDLAAREIDLDYGKGDVLNVTSTIDVADIDSIRAHWNGPQNWHNEDEIIELKFDAKYNFYGDTLDSIEAGISYFDREKSSNHYDWGANPTCSPCGGTVEFPNPEAIFGLVEHNDYMSEVSGTFPRRWIVLKDVAGYIAQTQQIMVSEGIITDGRQWNQTVLNPGNSYVNKEDAIATYIQANLNGDIGQYLWTGNIGLRFVETNNESQGFGQEVASIELDPNATSSELRLLVIRDDPTQLQASSSDSHFLPSANISLDLTGGLYLRAGAATTITRPAIEDTGVNQNVGVNDTGTIVRTGSNPFLEPYKVNQLDLSLEYYEDQGNAYSAAFFYKDINDFISTVTAIGPYQGVVSQEVLDRTANNSLTEVSTVKQNRTGGSVKGLEFSALHYFDYLPGLWSGLGVQANYTYADSKDDDAEPINLPGIRDPGSLLEGFAKNSYNLIGFYDRDGVQVRFAYNWRGNFMHARDGGANDIASGIPVHTEAYGQLDASFAYDINDNVTVFAEGFNLTNDDRVEYADIRSRVTLVEFSGARYQLGVRASF